MDERGPDLVDKTNESNKDDGSPPVTESPPCIVRGLHLTDVPAQHGLGGHHVITHWTEGKPMLRQRHCTQDPSLWLLCADSWRWTCLAPAEESGEPFPTGGRHTSCGLQQLKGGWVSQPKKGKRNSALSPVLPLSSLPGPGPWGTCSCRGRWEAGGKEVTSSGAKGIQDCAQRPQVPPFPHPPCSVPHSGGTICNCLVLVITVGPHFGGG